MARPRGNRWQADVIIDGRRVRKSFTTKEAAEEFERLSSLGVSEEVTLKGFATANFDAIWGENSYTEGNERLLGILYRTFGEDCPLCDLTTNRIEEAIAGWKRG